MRRLLSILIFALLCFTSAWSYTIDDLPMVPLQYTDSTDFNVVCNPDGILSKAETDSLNAMLWHIRQTKGVQGLVVCIKKMDPDDPYEFGITLFNKYKVGGKGQNAGFLVLLATEDRGYYINTGEGMEKYLTDGECGTIERRYMVPCFKEGKWGEGLVAGVKVICDVCSGQAELNASNEPEDADDEDMALALLVVFGPIAGCVGYAVYSDYRKKKCPKCGQHKLKHTMRKITKIKQKKANVTPRQIALGKDYIPLKCHIVDYYACEECHFEKTVESDGAYDDYKEGTFYGGADNWGKVITATSVSAGGYSRGRSSDSWGGGSSSHSTFGGGFSGGGGAGGRF